MAVQYPITLYKADAPSRIVHTPAELEKAQREGYTQGYIFQEFPALVYWTDGTTCKVFDEQDREDKIAAGYSKTPIVAAPEPEVKPKPTGPSAVASRIEALEADLATAVARIEALENVLTAKPRKAKE